MRVPSNHLYLPSDQVRWLCPVAYLRTMSRETSRPNALHCPDLHTPRYVYSFSRPQILHSRCRRCLGGLRDRGSWSVELNRHRDGISIQQPTTNAQSCGRGGLFASADFRSLEQSRPGTVTCRSFVYGGYCAGIEFSRLALNSRFSLAVSAWSVFQKHRVTLSYHASRACSFQGVALWAVVASRESLFRFKLVIRHAAVASKRPVRCVCTYFGDKLIRH